MSVFVDVSWPDTQRWVRANILLNMRGDVSGPDGTSATLTRGRDRELLRQLRADADIVIVGGASVRAEGWFFAPKGDILVVSLTGDLPMVESAHPDRVHVVSSVTDIPRTLDSVGAKRVICEAGPRLLRLLLRDGLVDELFVSVTHDLTELGVTDGALDQVIESVLGHISAFDLAERTVDVDVAYSRYRRRRVLAHNEHSPR